MNLSLYLVTHRLCLDLEDFYKIIYQAAEGGVSIVQLREKEISSQEMVHMGKRLLSILKPFGIPLLINDRIDVAQAINADGVHLGQSDVRVSEARAFLGKEKIIGLSVETIAQAQAAESDDVDYLAASPVFSTRTKQDCAPPWGLDGLKQLCSTTRHPVVAIGGINETNLEQVVDCGATGIAVVSAIFGAPCPKAAAQTLIKKVKDRIK